MAPSNLTVSTHAAADVLRISHQALLGLLEHGEIPYTEPGDQRRVCLEDLLAYRDRVRRDLGMLADLK